MSARPFLRSQDLPNCGAVLGDGKRCERAPARPANPLRMCEDCAASRASGMLAPAEDIEREAIVAEGCGRLGREARAAESRGGAR